MSCLTLQPLPKRATQRAIKLDNCARTRTVAAASWLSWSHRGDQNLVRSLLIVALRSRVNKRGSEAVDTRKTTRKFSGLFSIPTLPTSSFLPARQFHYKRREDKM